MITACKWITLAYFCAAVEMCAQEPATRPLPLPRDNDHRAAQAKQLSPAEQVAALTRKAAEGDGDAAFQLGIAYLIGKDAGHDPAAAASYLSRARLTPSRDCFVAEMYFESSLPDRLKQVERWGADSKTACGFVVRAQVFTTGKADENPEREIELLKSGLALNDDGYQRSMRARLGDLILAGKKVQPTDAERVAWIGEAARQKMGQFESLVAWKVTQHSSEFDSPSVYTGWLRKAARYGMPAPLAGIGKAAMSREVTDLSYSEGMGMLALSLSQSPLTAIQLEGSRDQMEPEQRGEVEDAFAMWERVRKATGGYYTRQDSLRMQDSLNLDALKKLALPADPDAELRLAYALESSGDLKSAEVLYRSVWANGPRELLQHQGQEAAKASHWKWARDLYTAAADQGSRPACAELARMDSEGQGGDKNPVTAYEWTLRSETPDKRLLAARKALLSAAQLDDVKLAQAQWLLGHQDFWKGDVKAAEELVTAKGSLNRGVIGGVIPIGALPRANKPPAPEPAAAEMRRKADAGDKDAAYAYAIDLLWGRNGAKPNIELIEGYAGIGARTDEQKAHIADGYARGEGFDEATSRKFAEKWYTAAGGSRGFYELAKVFNGKSDGIVATDGEKKAVQLWQRAVDGGEERWARLSRMELGYRVVKGWTSGDRAKDASWAHELALEMMGKEFYQVAGEYSYGSELPHDDQTFLLLSERAAIYNIDNAQGQMAQGILGGTWKRRDDIDAYVWLKLQAVKQDVGGREQVDVAEKNPELKRRIEDRYVGLMKTRQESGAYYPADDPLRTAQTGDLDERAKFGDPEAQLRLASLLEKGGDASSLDRAVDLYRKIWATAGQEVRLTWGKALMFGSPGVPRDDKGAEKWLWDAANAGSHKACELLAVIYGEGRGVKADPAAAAAWLRLSGSSAVPSGLSDLEKTAAESKVADWTSKHPGW